MNSKIEDLTQNAITGIIVVKEGNVVRGISPETKAEVWSFDADKVVGNVSALETLSNVDTDNLFASKRILKPIDGTVYVEALVNFKTILINTEDGKVVYNSANYKYTVFNSQFLYKDNEYLVKGVENGKVIASLIDLNTGDVKWKTEQGEAKSMLSSMYLRLIESKGIPKLELNLEHLIFVSKLNKGKKIEILNTDQPSINKEFNSDQVSYTGQIVYPIKTKRPTKIDLLLVNNGELLKLKEFEPRLSCDMTDTMLFDAKTARQVSPSRNIEYGNNHFYLFTIKNFDVKWVSESCEVTQFNNFGKYHVYEIKWMDTYKPLEIKVDYEHRWIFSKYIDFRVEYKEYKNTDKSIEFKKNQFLSLKDMAFKVIFNSEKFNYSDLKIALAYNFHNVSNDVRVSQVNTLLGREVNSVIIDEEFIKVLMSEHSNLSYGRYTFKFKLHDTNILNVETFYIPELYAEEQNDLYQQDDEIIVSLSTDDIPCFRNNKVSQNYLFDKPVSGNFITNHNKHIEFKKEVHTKKARLFNPYTEVTLRVEPDVAAFTFMQEGRF
ncbi:MAG: hypothetical protein ACK4IX_08910, partial [Candidatus Sericytochromatia bacterium]